MPCISNSLLVSVIPRSDAESSVSGHVFTMRLYWIPRRSAELKVAVKAMTDTNRQLEARLFPHCPHVELALFYQ